MDPALISSPSKNLACRLCASIRLTPSNIVVAMELFMAWLKRVALPSFVMSFRHAMVATSVSKNSAWKFRRPSKNSEPICLCTAASKIIARCALTTLTRGRPFIRGTRIARRRKTTSCAICHPRYSVQRMIAPFKRQHIRTSRSTNDHTQVNQRSRRSSAIMKTATKYSTANVISSGTKRLTLESAKNGYVSVVPVGGKQAFDIHKRAHCRLRTTSIIHECPNCGKRYGKYDTLAKHRRTAHPRPAQVIGFATSSGLLSAGMPGLGLDTSSNVAASISHLTG